MTHVLLFSNRSVFWGAQNPLFQLNEMSFFVDDILTRVHETTHKNSEQIQCFLYMVKVIADERLLGIQLHTVRGN